MTNNLPPERFVETRPALAVGQRHRSMGLLFAYSCAVAAITLAVDLGSKQLALRFLDTEARIPVLGDLLGLQLAFNTGAAFSIGAQLTPLITVLGLAAAVFLVRAAARTRHRFTAIAIGLGLGGALGNLVDRIFSPQGFGRGAVTDFVAYGHLFIGNLADVAIAAGIGLYLFAVWRKKSPATRSVIAPDPLQEAAAATPRASDSTAAATGIPCP